MQFSEGEAGASTGLSKQLFPTFLGAKETFNVLFGQFIFFDLLKGSRRPAFIQWLLCINSLIEEQKANVGIGC